MTLLMSTPTKPAESQLPPRRSDAFGRDLLGVMYLAPDFYEDIRLEDLFDEDDLHTCGGEDGG